jgi:hypothetical protein
VIEFGSNSLSQAGTDDAAAAAVAFLQCAMSSRATELGGADHRLPQCILGAAFAPKPSPVVVATSQGYCPGTVVLAQQLLLALSPLHAQLLPRPETAFLCPSSFRPAIGKLLMRELLSRPVLDMFQHSQAQLSMWHVWWHIGLRRYGTMQQQQQQPQQQGLGGTKVKGSSSSSNSSSSFEDGSSIYALYLDPEAR